MFIQIKKLEAGDGLSGGSTVGTISSGYGNGAGAAGTASASSMNVDRKAEEDLATMSNDRRQIVDALTEERGMLMESNQQLEKKTHAQKVKEEYNGIVGM